MTTQLAERPKQPVTIVSCLDTPRWREEIKKVLPADVVMEAILRVARSAVSANRSLANCDPQSFLLALLKCGRAGLYPDGREAHLIPYKDQVQAIFDWKGIVALVKRSGVDVTVKLVYRNDQFEVFEDDGVGRSSIIHRVDYKKERGDLMAVWSRAMDRSSRADYEIMTIEEVEDVRRKFSRAADSDAWKKSFGEMAKKTCIRRHSKRWDLSPEVRDAINGDDDVPDFTPQLATTEPKLQMKAKQDAVDVTSKVTISKGLEELVASIEKKSAASKIGAGALMEFIKEICPIQSNTLADAAVEAEETIRMIDEQWDDIAQRIHGTK